MRPRAVPDAAITTVICVTASNEAQARAVEAELNARRDAGLYGPDILTFAVPDPSNARVGSGGATLNALVTLGELLSGQAVRLDMCRIFLIHSGGDSQRLPCQSVCGKAWSALPLCGATGELSAPIDLLVEHMFRLFRGVRAGLVVLSSDVLLLVPAHFHAHWPQVGATGLAIPTDAAVGPNHGVYHVSGKPVIPDDPAARTCFPVARCVVRRCMRACVTVTIVIIAHDCTRPCE